MINLFKNNCILKSKFTPEILNNLTFRQNLNPDYKTKAESFDDAKINAALDLLGVIN